MCILLALNFCSIHSNVIQGNSTKRQNFVFLREVQCFSLRWRAVASISSNITLALNCNGSENSINALSMFQCRPQKWECSPKAAMPWRTSATTRARIWASPAPCPEVMYCNILYIDQINLPQEEVVLKLIYCPLQHLSSSILRSSDDQSKDWFSKRGSRRGRGAPKCPLSITLASTDCGAKLLS